MKRILTALLSMVLAGTAMADTFYLQADMPLNPEPDANDPSWYYDAPVGGNQMTTNDAFSGNFFDCNGYNWRNFYTNAAFYFEGTLVRSGDENILMYAKPAFFGGLEWLSDATRDTSFKMRQSNADITITNLNVEALMIIRANSSEVNMNLNVPNLTGGGTIQFGTDSEESISTWGLDIGNSAFTGSISITVGNLLVNDTLVLTNADLAVLSGGASVTLSADASFNSVVYGADAIPAGTYTAAELNEETGTSNFAGPGSLTVLADNSLTFYLQANKANAIDENDQSIWWDQLTGGNNMTNVLGADFPGNRFKLTTFNYYTKTTPNAATFGGTLVKDDSNISNFSKTWNVAGIHVTTNAVSGNPGLLNRRIGSTVNAGSLKLDGLLVVRANTTEQHLNLNVSKLTGAGTLRFGRDNNLGEDGDSIWGLGVDNSSFSGVIEIFAGILQFNDTLALNNATLKVKGGATVNTAVILSNNVAFAAMDYDGSPVADGVYTAGDLNSILGTDRFSGPAELTVGVPPAGLPYIDWLALYPGLGTQTNLTDDVEPDGMNNLLEYALGGDPLVDDAATILPVESVDGTYMNYVYARRTDAASLGLSYDVYSTLNLVFGTMTNATEEAGSVLVGDGFESVTNRVPIAGEDVQFMGLKVGISE